MKPKRILYLFASYPLWSEGFLRQDLGGLLSCGLPIVAASLFPGDCEAQPGWPSVRCLSSGDVSSRPSGCGLSRFVPRRFRVALTAMRHHSLFSCLLELCRSEYITHVHGEFADIAGLFAARAAARLGCTYSVGLHADDCLRMKYPPSCIFKDALFATVCNNAARTLLLKTKAIDADKLHLCRHGVDLRFWKYNEARHSSNGLDILFAGRLTPKKGLDLLLEALANLPERFTLKVAGSGPGEENLRNMAQSLGISSRVTWLGAIGQNALRSLFASSSCLCVPSVDGRGGMDGVPNVILEAMASGLPVMAYGSGGIGEALDDSTGFIVETRSAEALAEAMLFIDSHEKEAEERRRQARLKMESFFDAEKLARQRAAYFEEI